MYNEPGRMAATGGPKASVFFVFASKPLDFERDDVEQQKKALAEAFHGAGWKVPQLIEQLPAARDFHLDSISRVRTNHYAKGRVVLLGDSAYGNALGGFGTGLAIVGAYVLAGEPHRAHGDHTTAFAQYESKFRGYAKISQKVNAGALLAPPQREPACGCATGCSQSPRCSPTSSSSWTASRPTSPLRTMTATSPDSGADALPTVTAQADLT